MAKYIKTPAYVDRMPVDISFVFEDEKPAGKHGFLTVRDGEFRFEDGAPGRFWGVCMNGTACFPSHEYAEKVADRLAQTGINIVRLHQLDGEYHATNIFQFRKGKQLDNTRSFDPQSMDRLDYFIKCLKERGIYCYLDMMVFRTFKPGDGVVDAEKFPLLAGRPYSVFDPVMIELQKEYATNLWTHHNPYTELDYKDDPVFVLSEIVNETDIWHRNYKPSKGQPKPEHSPYYENELRELLREWAKENGEDVDADTVDVWSLDEDAVNRCKLELERRFHRTMYDHIRSLGVKIPITGCNWINSPGGSYNIYEEAGIADYTDNHAYYYDWAWGETEKFGLNVLVNGVEAPRPALPKTRIKGMPMFVSEWAMPFPNSYRAEGPVYFAALCALQGWGGMTIHTYAYGTMLEHVDMLGKEYSSATLGGVPYREGIFSCWNDPAVYGLFYHSALMVRRADVAQAKKLVGVRVPPAIVFPGAAFGSAADCHRVAALLDGMSEDGCDIVLDAKEKLPREDPNRIVSDNGQIWRDLKNKFSGIDTERTKIVYGRLGKVSQGVTPQAGTEVTGMKVESRTDFAVIALSSLNDTPICKSGNMLLTAVGRTRNTDMQFDGERLVDYGHGPIEAEAVCATITLETERTDLRVWGINAEGYYCGRVPAKFEDGKMIFTLGDQFPCVYYLVNAE
ncbi:MAG: hypothetical protein IJT18_00250 [Oscillospiraceae bacterium]|nr:hypothetical protein [Oscillospiraceae bacterium]